MNTAEKLNYIDYLEDVNNAFVLDIEGKKLQFSTLTEVFEWQLNHLDYTVKLKHARAKSPVVSQDKHNVYLVAVK